MVHTLYFPLQFVIVSRPESHLLETFEELDPANITQAPSLYGDHSRTFRDVFMLLRTEFSRIHSAKRRRDIVQFVPSPWPSSTDW